MRLPEPVRAGLAADGFLFHFWGAPAAGVIRLVTAWSTDPADVDALVTRAAHHAGAARAGLDPAGGQG